jgi:hypothetical protein
MQYSQEQYVQAIKAAEADNNLTVAQELAEEAAKLYGPLEPAAPAPEPFGPGIGLQRASATLQEEIQEFGPEFSRRAATVVGRELDPVDIPSVAGVALSQTARAGGAVLNSYLGGLIPASVKEGAADLYKDLQGTRAFQVAADAVSKGFEAYDQWSQANPEAAEKFETAVDIQALFSPRPDMPEFGVPKGPLTKAQKEAREATRTYKKQGVTTLLEPSTPQMRDVIEEKGILRAKDWQPNDFDNQVIETVVNMKGVKPKRSYTYNYREVQKEVAAAKKATDDMIVAQNKKINSAQFVEDMQKAVDEVLRDDIVRIASGDIQKQLAELAEIVMESVQTNGSDLVGVLAVRRKFDELMNNFDGQANAKSIAGRKIRSVLNDTLKANTRGEKLHNLLTKQFHGLTAMETMLPKRNAEAANTFGRLTKNLKEVDLLPSTVLALTTTAGVAGGALGGAVPAAVAIGTGGAVYAGVQLMKPRNRLRVIASMLSATDRALKTTQDAYILKQLEIDRAMLVDLIDQARDEVKAEESSENE